MTSSSLPPSVSLPYTIESCSSYSPKYHPDNILVDRPEDTTSRWTTERHPNPEVKESHWIILRLDQMSVATTITFGKYIAPHPCNIQSFRVYGGIGTRDREMRELLSAKLNDDNIPQTFSLKHKSSASEVIFPCQFIKICPLSTHGKSYNMSIWHVALTGITTPFFVKEVHSKFKAHKNNQSLHLILKHLRQNNYLAAHSTLLAQTNIRTEHPRVTELHDALVLNGDLIETEELIKRMAREDKLFDYCARVSPPGCVWRRLTPDGPIPPGRGGHQLCMDVEKGIIYLFGGWDGSKNLADFWYYHIASDRWTLLSQDTGVDGGPSARSCHNMVFCPSNGNLYVLGQLKDAPKAGSSPHLHHYSEADFFVYLTHGSTNGTWRVLNPEGVDSAGGPLSVSDHQMVIDENTKTLYVFGGRIESPLERDHLLYSGMYSFQLDTQQWTHIFPDPTRPEGHPNKVYIHSRTGHGMVIHPPTHEIFIVGGRRSNSKYLPDMHSFSPSTRTSQRLPFDPAIASAANAPRVCIDEELGEIYVLIWQNAERDRDRARVPNGEPETFATYHISEKRWVRSEPMFGPDKKHGRVGERVWEELELPRPRSAHQVVYDSINKVFYMFGGNSGEDGVARLNDLWSMKLIRPTVEELLRKALLAVRKYRFKKMCDTTANFEALSYLQSELAEVVDQTDDEESADLRGLLSYLLNKTANGVSSASVPTQADQEREERRELFDSLMQFIAPDQREPDIELSDIIESA